MNPTMVVATTALLAAAGAPFATPAVASAEPGAPQANTECAPALDGALTQLLDYTTRVTTYLHCGNQPGVGYRWQVFDSPYPNSDQWLSFGPKLVLHGEGQANREIDSGNWIGYPQDSGSRCAAQQQAVVRAGTVTAPLVSTGQPGQRLQLKILPLLFTIELSGYCLWQKED
jgi:hypothetical protein